MTDRSGADPQSLATRRTVLRGALLAGAAIPFLTACGGDSTSGDTNASSPDATSENGGGDPSGGDPSGGGAIATTADVPEGGGLIIDDPQVVITQPTAGEFKGFSSICTHQGCIVNDVSGGTINCPCHGSQYSIKNGSVVGGPAPSPLPEQKLTVKADSISLA